MAFQDYSDILRSGYMAANPGWSVQDLANYLAEEQMEASVGIGAQGFSPAPQPTAFPVAPTVSPVTSPVSTAMPTIPATTAVPAAPAAPRLDYTQYGFDPEYIRSPAQQFRGFATGFRPGWQRQAFYTQEPRLTQQYLLGLPGEPQSFEQFLSGYDPASQLTGSQMRSRAQEIAEIQGLSQADWLAYLGGGGPEDFATGLTPLQQTTYRDLYGPGGENVQDLATAMALQRSEVGTTQYQGVLGQAITNVMNDLYTQFSGENPGGNFLEWYLTRSAPGTGRLAF